MKTLLEAIVLVFLVMYLFLQNLRATLIPTIAVPVVLLGTFGVLAALGFSINTLTMFGMVLAIGLLVDDAIVVVENVERVMAEEGLSPQRGDAQVDGPDHRRAGRHRAGARRRCSCRWRSSAARPASSTGSSRSRSSSAMRCRCSSRSSLTPALCATLLKPLPKARTQANAASSAGSTAASSAAATRYAAACVGDRSAPRPLRCCVYVALLVG